MWIVHVTEDSVIDVDSLSADGFAWKELLLNRQKCLEESLLFEHSLWYFCRSTTNLGRGSAGLGPHVLKFFKELRDMIDHFVGDDSVANVQLTARYGFSLHATK